MVGSRELSSTRPNHMKQFGKGHDEEGGGVELNFTHLKARISPGQLDSRHEPPHQQQEAAPPHEEHHLLPEHDVR